MQVSRWNSSDMTCNRSLMFSQSQQASSSICEDEMQRTPVRRQNRSASRKNLSRSFSQILNEEFGEECAPTNDQQSQEAIRMLPLIHSELIAATDEEELCNDVFVQMQPQPHEQQDQKRLFIRTRSAHASDSMYRTDSGFNDDDLTSSSAGVRSSGQVSFSTPSTRMMVGGGGGGSGSDDVSMRSFRCDVD